MSRALRWARWMLVGTAVLLLFWAAAVVGGWAPGLQRLATSVHGPLVADYRADSPARLAPLSPDVLRDAAGDHAAGSGSATPRPSTSPGGSASPSPSASGPLPTPSPSIPTPTLPVPTPTLPVPTPTLPVPTPTLPVPTPTLPVP
ncbi:MAG TPA: hypothetical protein VII89_10580 [Candidatus Dormibacteraeota bacterium]